MTSAHPKPEFKCVKRLALRDNLLLETGFLAILIAPMKMPWSSKVRLHDSVTFWLVRWLLFRLMFVSGVVKLTSRCPTWWGLTGEESAEYISTCSGFAPGSACIFTVCEHNVTKCPTMQCSGIDLLCNKWTGSKIYGLLSHYFIEVIRI